MLCLVTTGCTMLPAQLQTRALNNLQFSQSLTKRYTQKHTKHQLNLLGFFSNLIK